MTRLARAVEAVDERLGEIAAGWLDMSHDVFGVFDRAEWDANPLHGRRYQTRLKHTLLSISHLRDDSSRLAKAMGKPRSLVEGFVENNLFVDVARGVRHAHPREDVRDGEAVEIDVLLAGLHAPVVVTEAACTTNIGARPRRHRSGSRDDCGSVIHALSNDA